MKSIWQAILYGFLVWVVTLTVAMILYQVRGNDRVFFESLIPVVLGISVVVASVIYFRALKKIAVREAWLFGFVLFTVNFVLDQLVFNWGPMKMSFVDYLKDIGVTYLLLIAIPAGFGYLKK
jgi:hypothetical protein